MKGFWRIRGRRPRSAASTEHRSQVASADTSEGTEPDARFTFANERTFLAWNRTALALIVAGLAIVQLLPPFRGVPWGRHLLAVPLIVFGAVLSIGSYIAWVRDQRALRSGRPLPHSLLPHLLTIIVSITALLAALVVLLSVVTK